MDGAWWLFKVGTLWFAFILGIVLMLASTVTTFVLMFFGLGFIMFSLDLRQTLLAEARMKKIKL